jgi:hypothetical protein
MGGGAVCGFCVDFPLAIVNKKQRHGCTSEADDERNSRSESGEFCVPAWRDLAAKSS